MHNVSDIQHFAHLIALHADVAQKEFTLDAKVTTLGRLDSVCDLIIHRPTASRIHARIERHGSHYVLTNLSRNQTFVNGASLEGPYILNDRDVIGLASPEPLLRFLDYDPTVAITGRLNCNPSAMQFTLDNQLLQLTPTQYKLLLYLYQHPGEICSHEKCEQAVWGEYPIIEPSALHRLIADLRAEMHRIDPDLDLIETRRGIGYILNPL